jgi:glycosyltransferase involved in cell wall biosynthesis
MSKITFIIPARNEEDGISHLVAAINSVFTLLEVRSHTLEVIIVDNHSSDKTFERLLAAEFENKFDVFLYQLNRNYGLQRSILFGMSKATGDALIVFQSDLQDPIDAAMKMICEWENGAKVVAGISHKRNEKSSILFTSGLFYNVINFLTDIRMLRWFQDFFLLDKDVYSDLCRRVNHFEFLRGRLIEEYGINSVVYYRRLGRTTGKSNFNFAGRYGIALDGITRFGSKLIRRFVIFGASLFFCSSAIFIVNLIAFIITGERYFGNILTWMVILLLGVTVFALGLTLEYLIRLLKLSSTNSTEVLYKTSKKLNQKEPY